MTTGVQELDGMPDEDWGLKGDWVDSLTIEITGMLRIAPLKFDIGIG
jgi:hypothetical protein